MATLFSSATSYECRRDQWLTADRAPNFATTSTSPTIMRAIKTHAVVVGESLATPCRGDHGLGGAPFPAGEGAESCQCGKRRIDRMLLGIEQCSIEIEDVRRAARALSKLAHPNY